MENQGAGSSGHAPAQTAHAVGGIGRLAVPFWYWGALALLFGLEVAAVSTGRVAIFCIGSVLILFAGRGLNYLLAAKRGIKVGRVFGGAGTWLVAPLFALLAALCVFGTLLTSQQGAIWPAVLAGVVAAAATLGFGYCYDRIRLQRMRNLAR